MDRRLLPQLLIPALFIARDIGFDDCDYAGIPAKIEMEDRVSCPVNACEQGARIGNNAGFLEKQFSEQGKAERL